MRRAAAAAATFLALTLPHAAAAQAVAVDLELVLAVDTSFSVDQGEFALQMEGIAQAFEDPDVINTITSATPGGIAVALVQWAGENSPLVAVSWHYVREASTAAAFAGAVRAAGRQTPPGPTAIGDAVLFSARLILDNGFAGTRRTIDVSGDGINNQGTDIDAARDTVIATGITINGLTILNEAPYLEFYFQNHVIGGQGSFTLSSPDYDGFATAMRLKLIQEIRGPGMAEAPIRPRTRLAER